MKNIFVLLILVFLVTGCRVLEQAAAPTPGEAGVDSAPEPKNQCGDGVCDGPETAENCPGDCQQVPMPSFTPALDTSLPPMPSSTPALDTSPPPALDTPPPLYFFYAIHAHGANDLLPYTDPGMTDIDPGVAENMIAAIEGIAAVLDEYGVKGTWEFLPATVKGLVTYQGEDNIFVELLSNGHEIGVHAHKLDDVLASAQALRDYGGISPVTTSGFITQVSKAGLDEAQSAMSEAVALPVGLGLTVGTTNLTPGISKNPLGTICNDGFGVGNDMWEQTGNLMFPWRPDYIHEDICSDNPASEMVFVSHASIESLILPDADGPPDVLDARHFNQLKGQFEAALSYMADNQPQRAADWGFVTHIIEYALGSQGENPPDPAALGALSDFLSYVDSKQDQGLVVYATAAEIANLITVQGP